MRIELLFDEKTYREQIKILYNLAYQKKLNYYKNSHYLGFSLLIIGIFFIINSRTLGYIFIFFGLGILIPYFIVYSKHFRMSKKLSLEQNETVLKFNENRKSIWEFTEDNLKYSDFESEKIIEWNKFSTYTVIEDNLFMFTKNFEPFIIGKSELSTENYNDIIKLVDSKIKK